MLILNFLFVFVWEWETEFPDPVCFPDIWQRLAMINPYFIYLMAGQEIKSTVQSGELFSFFPMGTIQDIDKGGGEIIRIEISEYKGQSYLNLRVWYTDKNSGEFKPTQKGITVKPELFSQLKEAVLKAEPEINLLLGKKWTLNCRQ